MTMNFNGRVWEADETVPSGESRVFQLPLASPASVAVHPAEGATATVEMTLSPLAKVEAGTARWLPTSIGATSVADSTDIPSPVTALRVTAAGGAVAVEVQQ